VERWIGNAKRGTVDAASNEWSAVWGEVEMDLMEGALVELEKTARYPE
jgi:hypothetical protein